VRVISGRVCNYRAFRLLKTSAVRFEFQPSIDERQIRELRSLRFVHDASNAIHLSVAFAEAAIQAGYGAYS
jgi:hypothetical protein